MPASEKDVDWLIDVIDGYGVESIDSCAGRLNCSSDQITFLTTVTGTYCRNCYGHFTGSPFSMARHREKRQRGRQASQPQPLNDIEILHFHLENKILKILGLARFAIAVLYPILPNFVIKVYTLRPECKGKGWLINTASLCGASQLRSVIQVC